MTAGAIERQRHERDRRVVDASRAVAPSRAPRLASHSLAVVGGHGDDDGVRVDRRRSQRWATPSAADTLVGLQPVDERVDERAHAAAGA